MVILGPVADIAMKRLTAEMPDQFEIAGETRPPGAGPGHREGRARARQPQSITAHSTQGQAFSVDRAPSAGLGELFICCRAARVFSLFLSFCFTFHCAHMNVIPRDPCRLEAEAGG